MSPIPHKSAAVSVAHCLCQPYTNETVPLFPSPVLLKRLQSQSSCLGRWNRQQSIVINYTISDIVTRKVKNLLFISI